MDRPRTSEPAAANSWRVFLVTLGALLLIGAGYVAASAVAGLAAERTGSMAGGAAFSILAFEFLFLAAALAARARFSDGPPRRFRELAWGVAGGAAILALNGALSRLAERAGMRMGVDPDLLPDSRHAWIAWMTALPAAALAEEWFFRGALPALYARAGARPPLAIALSAVLFGLIHAGQGAVAIPLTALLALPFFWLRKKTGGLLAPVVAHYLVDLAGLLLLVRARR